MPMTLTPGLDTMIFAALALVGLAMLTAPAWARRIRRDMEKMEEASLEDDDMRDDDHTATK